MYVCLVAIGIMYWLKSLRPDSIEPSLHNKILRFFLRISEYYSHILPKSKTSYCMSFCVRFFVIRILKDFLKINVCDAFHTVRSSYVSR